MLIVWIHPTRARGPRDFAFDTTEQEFATMTACGTFLGERHEFTHDGFTTEAEAEAERRRIADENVLRYEAGRISGRLDE